MIEHFNGSIIDDGYVMYVRYKDKPNSSLKSPSAVSACEAAGFELVEIVSGLSLWQGCEDEPAASAA